MKLYYLALMAVFSVYAETNKELLKKLSENDSYGNVIKVFEGPNKETTISMEYSFDEMKLQAKDVLYFYVPERLSLNPVSQVGFSHRQIGRTPERDLYPGLTSALVYSKDMPGDELRFWAGHSSGKLGAKFAEYRPAPEFDALYEWPKTGHRGINNRERNKAPVRANVVRIQNVGTDDVFFSKLYLETIPERAQIYQNVVFTPDSNFGDPVTMEGRYYGGGQSKRGKFPQSLRLSSRGHRTQPSLPDNMVLDKNELSINLPKGSRLKSIDIMCGDTHPDEVRNKDGGWGSLGTAKVSVRIENALTGKSRILLHDKNVGPQGVITAADIDQDQIIEDGDRLIIANKHGRSTAYIMALRIGYNK